MAFRIRISTGSSRSLYRQIVEQFRKAMATGALTEGQPVASVRALAEQLVINPNTVAHAYAELVEMGLLESRQGVGFFVASRIQTLSKTERQKRLNLALEQFVSEATLLGLAPAEIREALDRELSKWSTSR